MMKEDEKWIKAFKDKLEDYSEPMPASGWERLERELMPVTVSPVGGCCGSCGIGANDCCQFVFSE